MTGQVVGTLAIAAVLLATGPAATLPNLGGAVQGGNQSLNVDLERRDPPSDECNCPAIYDPVVCRNAAGTVQSFSSPCLAQVP